MRWHHETRVALIVLGMHRAGTSAVAGMLRHLGIDFGPDLIPAAADNPRGFWEHREIVEIHELLLGSLASNWNDYRALPENWMNFPFTDHVRERLAAVIWRDFSHQWIFGIKDPRLCRLLTLWIPLLAKPRIEPRFILVWRHPIEIAASLAQRDGMTTAHAIALRQRYLDEAVAGIRNYPSTFVRYSDLVGCRGWRFIARQISRDLDVRWPRWDARAVRAYLTPTLRHHRI